jgi:hypothetical protein
MVLVALLRGTDLVLLRRATTTRERVVHALLVTDSFQLRPVQRGLDRRMATRAVLFLALLEVGRRIAFDLAPHLPEGAPRLAVRWLGVLVFVYALTDAAYAVVALLHRAAGYASPMIHRDPVLSRSVREFWGNRWNRIVGGWLRAYIYRPLARRGQAGLGMLLAFVASALIHLYVALPALGTEQALIVAAFFVVQGVFALVEGPLRVASWPPWAGHTWTLTAMIATSPLFVEPLLRVIS